MQSGVRVNMRTLGLIGGMSWESTALYYAEINRNIAQRLGGLNSAKIILGSVNFAEIVAFQQSGNWDGAGASLADLARNLEAAGANIIALAVNTMHKVAPRIQEVTQLPFIDIRTVVAEAVRKKELKRVALLGTSYVMEESFYVDKLSAEGQVDIVMPELSDRLAIHNAIYKELSLGQVRESTRQNMLKILSSLKSRGAEGAVLACTELAMLRLDQLISDFPLFDSTGLHCVACVEAII